MERGAKFYAEYSEVSDFFLTIRKIVEKSKKPRRVEMNTNLIRYNSQVIEPMVYPESFEGLILSYADRYPYSKKLYSQVTDIWNQHKESLRV